MPKRESISQYDAITGIKYMIGLGNNHIHAQIKYESDYDAPVYSIQVTQALRQMYFNCKDSKDINAIRRLANYIRMKTYKE